MKERIFPVAKLYCAVERDGTPVALRPEFEETVPQHADMLRYDEGFCDPNQIDHVVFPVFNGKNGRGPLKITRDRWLSFGLLLESTEKEYNEGLAAWVTYRHQSENPLLELVPVTLDEYLKQRPSYKVVAWR